MELDAAAAETAIEEHVAEPLDMSVEAAALAIRSVIDDKMAAAVRATSIEEGYDPREFWLMGFGGAGPMHACAIAAALDIDRVVFPNHAGLASAVGLLVSDIKHDYVRSFISPAADADHEAINGIIDELYDVGRGELETEDVPPEDRRFTVLFDVRYEGQAHNLTVPLGDSRLTEASLDRLLDAFEAAHQDKYDFTDEREAIELVNVRVTAEGVLEDPDLAVEAPETAIEDARTGRRSVVIEEGNRVEATCYDRGLLAPDHEIDGPAVVEAENSTMWLPPGTHAAIDEFGNVIVEVSGR
jgi:N-methylhydantoinase A